MNTRVLAVLFLTTVAGPCISAAAPGGYLFTMPRRLWKGTKEKLCITRHGKGQQYEFNLDLYYWRTNTTISYPFGAGGSQCWTFDVPNNEGRHFVKLSGTDDTGNNFSHDTFVNVQELTDIITLIQCDKPMYKPGQTVKFRIMTIDGRMRPKTGNISEISIENPGGVRVRQWRDVDVSMGLASLEMKLSSDPTLGTWVINAEVDGKSTEQTFTVKEYVLPKFEVTVTPPPYLLLDSPTIDGKVCAKYTYGKPVRGLLVLGMCHKDYYTRTCYSELWGMKTKEIDGCHTFSVNSSELSLSSKVFVFSGTLKITANITERGTGVTLYGESTDTQVVMTPFRIDLIDETNKYFKPGLPYRVKVTAKRVDGSPVAGEQIQADAENRDAGFFRRQNFTTNENGYFWFAVTDIPENVTRMDILVRSLRYLGSHYNPHRRMPYAYYTTRKWYSPSNNYMHVQRVTSRASCGQTLDINVIYTSELNTTYKFYYMVISRSHVVYDNHRYHHFFRPDAIAINDTIVKAEKLEPYDQPSREPNYISPIDRPINGTNITSDGEVKATVEPEPEFESELGPEPESEKEPEEEGPLRHVAGFTLHIPVITAMAPEAQLLVYYIRDDGETIADTISFNIEKCFDNKVDMDFEQETVYPGEEAKIRVKAAPGSYCSIGVVDKSINLLGGKHQLTAEKIYDMIPNPFFYHSYREEDQNYCKMKAEKLNPEDEIFDYFYYNYETDIVDAIQPFRQMNLVVFTDLVLETRPCIQRPKQIPLFAYYSPIGSPGLDPPGLSGPVDRGITSPREIERPVEIEGKTNTRTTQVRSHFPETFLWDLELIGEKGELVMTRKVPHTITEWMLLSLKESTNFDLVSSERDLERCVCGGDSSSIKYLIRPTVIGEIEILATAKSIPDNGTCGNNSVHSENIGISDTVKRKLLIEAEGVEKDYTFSSYMCTEGGSVFNTIDLPLPPQGVVKDSARGKLSVIGDIMGPALSNLQDLLRMPYGCGEQNMASWSPNIVALQYLTNTNQLTKEIEDEALNYMRIGYQRQLNYRHEDSSYSAFGGPGSGSMWLTAFVVKCFGQAMPFIHIDRDDLNTSAEWLRSNQLGNGCFPRIGYTHSYYLKGGIGDGSNEAAMTAFVLIALLEAGVSQNDWSVANAVRCLDSQDNNDTYTLALMAYAYTLFNPNYSPRLDVMAELQNRTRYKDNGLQKYWTRGDEDDATPAPYSYAWYRAPSAEVEITAYILLATIIGEQENAVLNAQPIVTWLTKQRNALGGFSSTQDTIVALQALSEYATLIYSGGMDVSVTFRGIHNPEFNFRVVTDDSIVLKSETLEVVPDTLEAEVSGIGCAFLQVNVKYNVHEPPVGPAFTARVSTYRSKTKGNDCKRRTLQICVKFTGPGGVSNMAIVDVKMVTGWIPVTSTIDSLYENYNVEMENYEVEGNMVHIYFSKLDQIGQCFYFDVEQDIEVDEPDKAFVKVYDYYETDLQAVIPYKLTTTCNKDDNLPPIVPDHYFFCGMYLTTDEIEARAPPGPLEDDRADLNITAEATPALVNCPRCEDSLDATFSNASEYRRVICGAQRIYKVVAGRTGKYPMKIYTDISTKKKTSVQRFAYYEMDTNCTCDSIPTTESKILLITRGDIFDADTEMLILDDRTIVVPWSSEAEKAIRELVSVEQNGCS